MNRTKQTAQPTPTTPGFACLITDTTPLGLAMLIAEDEEGHTQPIAVASTLAEAKEMADADFAARIEKFHNSREAGFCPYRYNVWAAGLGGTYQVAGRLFPKYSPK